MKDQKKIADHLNRLREHATPYEITDQATICKGCKEVDDQLYQRLRPIIEAAEPALNDMEIALAAKEKREADLCRPSYGPYEWRRNLYVIPWKATEQLWLYCLPQLKEAVAAFNKEREQEYEQYRQACMQGVAVAPQE